MIISNKLVAPISIMKNFIKILLVTLIAFLVSNCSTAPEFKPQDGKTLVVGRIIYNGSGLEHRTVNMNGEFKRGIEVTIKQGDKDKVTVRTGDEGLFFYLADVDKMFEIKKIKFERTSDMGWSSTYTSRSLAIYPAENGVTNFGTILWNVTEDSHIIKRTEDDYNDTEKLFKKLFPDNIWSKKSWTAK